MFLYFNPQKINAEKGIIMNKEENQSATSWAVSVNPEAEIQVSKTSMATRHAKEVNTEEENSSQVVQEYESVLTHKMCEVCGNPFQAFEVLDTDLNQRPLLTTCDMCSYYIKPRTILLNKHDGKFNQLSDVKSIKEKIDVHTFVDLDKNHFSCQKCTKTFKKHSELLEHTRYIHGMQIDPERLSRAHCDTCGKTGGVITITENVKSPVHLCEMCYLVKQDGASDQNKTSEMFKCDLCDRQFSRKDHVTRHRMTHLDLKPFECYLCAKSFNRNDKLIRHLRTHPEAKPFSCTVCFQSFTVRVELQKHAAIHPPDSRLHKCQMCGKVFMDKVKLSRHHFTHEGYNPYKCECCSKTFKIEEKLLSHQQSHANWKPYVCETCGLSFKIKDSYNRHLILHSEEKVCKCHICLKSFSDNDTLRNHHLTHVDIRPYKCEICDRTFKYNDKLKRHRNEVHGLETGAVTVCDMVLTCEMCNKPFNCEDDLTEHKMVHYR